MKLILAFIVGAALTAFAVDLPRTKPGSGESTPINGRAILHASVEQVLEHGLLCRVELNNEGNYIAWSGTVFVLGHPKKATLTDRESAGHFTAIRIGNFKQGGETFRAYRFEKFLPEAKSAQR